MVEKPVKRDCWPDALEALLLRAGLAEPSPALAAWQEFCRQAPDDLPNDYLRLIPLVAVQLKECHQEPPRRDFLQARLREAWLRTQRLFHLGIPVLQHLQSRGIEFLLLKGAALAMHDYPHPGARPMVDIDLLVHPAAVRELERLLAERDWITVKPLSENQWADHLLFRHEMTFRHARDLGPEIDVHWHLVDEARHPQVEEFFWRNAVSCPLPGLNAKTLAPTDQFLHTCLHGVRWNEVSAVRWLADAALIAQHGLDWSRLERQARQLELIEPVRATILCLDSLGVALPAPAVNHWKLLRPTRRERWEKAYRSARPNLSDRTRQLALAYLRLQLGRGHATHFWRDLFSYMRQIHHFRTPTRQAGFIVYVVFYRLMGL